MNDLRDAICAAKAKNLISWFEKLPFKHTGKAAEVTCFNHGMQGTYRDSGH